MKKKSYLLAAVLTTFIILIITISCWLFHVRAISNSILLLKDTLQQSNIRLQYDDINFSKRSVFNIEADIKNIILTMGDPVKNFDSYHIDKLKLNSNLWTHKIDIEIFGDVSTTKKLFDRPSEGVYKFTHNPTIEITLPYVSLKTLRSLREIKQIKLNDVGYIYHDRLNGTLYPSIALENVNFTLDNSTYYYQDEPLNLEIQFNFLNHERLQVAEPNQNSFMQAVYKLMELSGKTSTSLVANISNDNLMNINNNDDDNNKIISVRLDKCRFSSALYTTNFTGVAVKKHNVSLPYFNLDVYIDNIESMVNHYTTSFNMSLTELHNRLPYAGINAITDAQSSDVANVFRKAAHASNNGEISFKILRDENNFLIADTQLPEFINRIRAIFTPKDDSNIAPAPSKK